MKTIIVIFALSFAYVSGFSQKVRSADVPSAVKTTFAQLYPNSKAEKWEKNEGFYEAKFRMDDKTMYMTLESSGEWVNTKIEIKAEELPDPVSGYVWKHYPGEKIREAFKVINAAGGDVTYQTKLEHLLLNFKPDGFLLNSEKEGKKVHAAL